MAVVAAVVAGAAVVGSTIAGASAAGKAERRARGDKNRLMDELEGLENSRQAIINPYENVSSLESMVIDNAGMLSNPYKNVGVATKAAEFQAEEADIALANTLDLLALLVLVLVVPPLLHKPRYKVKGVLPLA
jgi:hypothetical protein